MSPATIALLLNAALSALPELLSTFKQLSLSGEISVEDQAAIKAKLDALRSQDFTGPEWTV